MKRYFFVLLLLTVNIAQAQQHFVTFKSTEIDEVIKKRMKHSWRENNPVALSDLCYLMITYFGYDDKVHQGELIVNCKVAQEVIEIFKELFNHKFPIKQMKLVDEYDADDERSMMANNTSAFCSRPITGTTDKWSKHSYGIAIDVNPRENPYVKGNTVLPKNAEIYLNRSLKNIKGFITHTSICYKIFTKYGWKWGGNWQTIQDYQHFEKEFRDIE